MLSVILLVVTTKAHSQFLYETNNGTITITGYTGGGGSVVIPGALNGLPVTEIGDHAFYSTDPTSVWIPNSVARISSSAFERCWYMTNVVLGDSVATIDDRAFYQCANLTSITIPPGVTNIGDYAFYNTYLRALVVPENVRGLGFQKLCPRVPRIGGRLTN